MPALQLLCSFLAAAAVTAAAPVTDSTPARVCQLIFGNGDPAFSRYSISGTTECTCQSRETASCESIKEYPTAAPNSPDALLGQFHRPSHTALQALYVYQIQQTCRISKLQGRRCETTWPDDGSNTPVCDCARTAAVQFRAPYFVDDISSRRNSRAYDHIRSRRNSRAYFNMLTGSKNVPPVRETVPTN